MAECQWHCKPTIPCICYSFACYHHPGIKGGREADYTLQTVALGTEPRLLNSLSTKSSASTQSSTWSIRNTLWCIRTQRHTDLQVHMLAAGTIPSTSRKEFSFSWFPALSPGHAALHLPAPWPYISTGKCLDFQTPSQESGPNRAAAQHWVAGLTVPLTQKNHDLVYFQHHLF